MGNARMRLRLAVGIAVGSVGSITLVLVAGFVYADFAVSQIGLAAASATFGVVGAVIVAHVPGNRLGMAFAAIGFLLMFSSFQQVARPMIEAGVGPALVALGQAIADLSWDTGIFVMLVLVPLWFPDGRALSPRWGWLVRLGFAGWAVSAFLDLFSAEKSILWVAPNGWVPLANPIGFSWVPDNEESMIGGLAFILMVLCGLGALIALFVRYRRAGPVERLQIRWLRAAFLALGLMMFGGGVFESAQANAGSVVVGIFDVTFSLAVLLVPVSAAIAITRYRLYELGRIVSRTVTYGVVIGVLGLVFVVGALWLPQELSGSGSNLAVAASTLVVFALFAPLRRRVLATVDRRFNRLPYDADRVVAELRTRLGNELDMASVTASFLAASEAALAPATTAVWVRARS